MDAIPYTSNEWVTQIAIGLVCLCIFFHHHNSLPREVYINYFVPCAKCVQQAPSTYTLQSNFFVLVIFALSICKRPVPRFYAFNSQQCVRSLNKQRSTKKKKWKTLRPSPWQWHWTSSRQNWSVRFIIRWLS